MQFGIGRSVAFALKHHALIKAFAHLVKNVYISGQRIGCDFNRQILG